MLVHKTVDLKPAYGQALVKFKCLVSEVIMLGRKGLWSCGTFTMFHGFHADDVKLAWSE